MDAMFQIPQQLEILPYFRVLRNTRISDKGYPVEKDKTPYIKKWTAIYGRGTRESKLSTSKNMYVFLQAVFGAYEIPHG